MKKDMDIKRPLILITNDDGINARGILRLAEIASEFGEVYVVAPDDAQSGKSSAITVNTPLFITQHGKHGNASLYSVNGTPVDCVKLSLYAILDRQPDLVLSGINHGSNAAVNNIYSGTMGAAMEACIYGLDSIGFSLLDHSPTADFDPMAPFVKEIIKTVLDKGLPEGICLNINFPADCQPQGIKTVRAAKGYWTEEYALYSTPHGKPYYWLTGRFHNFEPDNADTDEYWLKRGYGTIVPIRPDQTAADMTAKIKEIFED